MSFHRTSPVHVHVADVTPVYVHVKSNKKKSTRSEYSECINNNNEVKSQSKRPIKYPKQNSGPWVPPPARTTRGSQYNLPCNEDIEVERMLNTINQCQDKMNCMIKEIDQLRTKNEEYAKELNAKKLKLESLENEKLIEDFKDSTDKFNNDNSNHFLLQKLIDLDIESNNISKLIDIMLDPNINKIKTPNEICENRKELNDRLLKFKTGNIMLRHLLRNEYKKISEPKIIEPNFDLERQQYVSKIASLCNQIKILEQNFREKEIYANNVEMASLEAKEKFDVEKEALKKSIKSLKTVVTKNEGSVNMQIQEVNQVQKKFEDCFKELEQSQKLSKKLADERLEAFEATNKLQIRFKELETLYEKNEQKCKKLEDKFSKEIHEKMQQLDALVSQNNNLKTSLNLAEDKLIFTQKEMTQIQSILQDYEKHLKHWEQVRCSIESIDRLPAQLRVTELKLSETNTQIDELKKQHTNDQTIIQTMKSEIENLKISLKEQQNANNQMSCNSPSVLQVEALSRDSLSLQQQLTESLKEGQKLLEQEQEKLFMKDRLLQNQLDDMQQQLNRCMQELVTVKREKEELEKKSKCKLIDYKDRLDKSHQTNSALHNYVQFMKNSYSNVFSASGCGNFKAPNNSTPLQKIPSMSCDNLF